MNAPYLYIVRFWVSPEGAAALLGWLDNRHMQDVVEQPGFLWARRARLDEDADDGWQAWMMIYGLESRDALMRYFDSPAPALFAEQRKPFERHMRMERCWGAVDFSLG